MDPSPIYTRSPVAANRDALIAALAHHQVVVCVGETGSGKTTQIPQYLLNAYNDGRVVVTQPRRVAAIAVAHRVASELGFARLADSPVGYAVRFDDRTTAHTKLKFCTDGVLVRECLADATLSAYHVVVLDEAHERSVDTDVLVALLKRAVAKRHDLRVLVTSATLDAARFAAFFATRSRPAPPIFEIPGRVFPVEIFHSKQRQIMGLRGPLSTYIRTAIEMTLQIHASEPKGHILVFLTGQHEIDDAVATLRKEEDDTLKVYPLYSALSRRAQEQVFQDVPSRVRKVVVATTIAETSLTIDGIRYVVDCGFTKHKVYNPTTQREALVVVPISKAAAQQRAGRAGRTAPGKCFRLYAKVSYDAMLDDNVPEIRRTNLASTVLYLKVLGIHNVLKLDLLDRPDDDALLDALAQLWRLDALDARGRVTTLGRLMSQFPLTPPLARALLEAIALDCHDEMAAIVAMLSVENVFGAQKNDEHDAVLTTDGLIDDCGDQLTYARLMRAFEAQRDDSRRDWCVKRGLQYRALSTAVSIQRQVRERIATVSVKDVETLKWQYDNDDARRKRSRSTRVRRALSAGFASHAARRCSLDSNVYRSMSSETETVELLHVHPLSTLVTPPPCCIYHELVVTSRPFMRHVVRVEEAWIEEDLHGKATLSRADLYALGGVKAPASKDRKRPSAETPADEEKEEAQSPQAETIAIKQQTIDAARARFLARKKAKR